jgi:PAS domain S-box-containing protein
MVLIFLKETLNRGTFMNKNNIQRRNKNIDKDTNERDSGITLVGTVTWGTHLCQFYQTREDLIDILVPYFKAGLENNEFCMWITSEPLHVEEAKKALQKKVKNLDDYLKKGQIEILDATQWYTKSGKFDADEVLSGWVKKEEWARKKGYEGLRLTGNTFWLEKKDWKDFTKYEAAINSIIGLYHMIAICSYSLDKCNASEIIDVVSNHQFALIKKEGNWHRIESPEMKKVEDELEAQRQLFETVVYSMPAAVNLIRGSDLRLRLVNPAYQAIAPGKDMLGKTLDELWPEAGQNFSKLCRKVLATGEPYHVTDELNMIRRRPDGPIEQAYFSWSLYRVRLPGDEGWGILNIAWETTERKKNEEERFRHMKIFDQIQDGIIISNPEPEFRITYWNKGAEQMYGYSQTEAIGKTSYELLRPSYAPGEREKIIDELNRIGTSKVLIHTKHRNGADIIVDVHSTRLTNESGSISGYVVTYRDVTDRERAQTTLKEAELKYRTVADNTYDFEFWLDPKGNYLYVSPSCKRITGYNAKEFLSNPSLRRKIVHPDDEQLFINHLKNEVSKKKPAEIEFRIIHKDRCVKWIHHVCQPIYDDDGQFLGTRGNNRDITERKRMEETLEKQHDELQTIFDTVPASIFYKNTENRFLRVNKSFTNMMDIPKEELEGKSLFDLYPKEQAEAFWKDDKEVITSGKQKINIIEPVETKKGLRWVQTHKIPYRDAQGNIIGVVGFTLDITERKKAIEQLRETRDYLEKLLNYANAPIIVWDKDFKIAQFNHAFEHLTGYSSENMIGKKLDILFPKESKEESLQKIQRTLSGEYWETVEIPILRKDKDIRIALWNSANIYDNTGKNLIATIAQGTDITDRKKVEKALKENETRLKHAQEMAHLGNWELNLINDQLTWSDEVYRIFGLQPQEFPATYEAFLETVHPDDRLAVDSAYSSSLRDNRNSYEIEHRIVRKNGEIRFVHEKCEHIRNKSGKVIQSIGMVHDITEFKKAEAELQESEEKYRRIVENTTNVIMVTQPDGIISYLSPSCKEIFGYLPEELIGTNPMIFHPDDTKKVQQALSRAIHGEKGTDFEYRIFTKGGDLKWISHSWSPIYMDNKIQSIISVISDITERKTTENKIKKLNDNLMRRTIELAVANKELETFSYSVSHDLRAPLRSIDGFSQALLEDYSNILDENGKEYLNRVRKATERMSQLIDDMLRLSRLTRVEMTIQKVDLSSIAKTVIDNLKKTDPGRKVTFITNEKLIAEGDANLLQILLENLLGNAWKFTKKNKQATIEFGKTKQDQETVFFIRDNGAGFNMKYVDKLFIPFQRLHDDAEYPGTGIGLGIVSRIINRHGGRIWADAEENKGATFYFTLGGKSHE